jgi:CelD/BcsL family acetyltransferase involved in cellulose biosynthesis
MSTASLAVQRTEPTVCSISDPVDFRGLEREWNDLVTTSNDSLFLRHEFFRVWWESFGSSMRIQVLTGRAPDGRLVAALPLMRQDSTIRGVPVRQAVSMANHHSCRFDMIAENPVAAGEAFFSYLAGQDDWDVLRIADVPQDGQAWHLYHAAAGKGFPVGAWESQRSPYLQLPPTEDELQGRVSSQLRSTARRRHRQMEKRGAVEFERLDGANLNPFLDDFFAVERSGWKGRDGTACDQDEQTRSFYTRLADIAKERDWLSMFRLTLDGRTVAFHYGLTYGSDYLLPKLAFREEFSDLSPGLVLMHEVLLNCIGRNLRKIDFLGSDDEWKTRWSPSVLPHSWLYVFRRNLKGRLLQSAKFRWGPWLKRLLGGGGVKAETSVAHDA